MKKYILSFDLSSSVCGYSIMEYFSKKLIKLDYFVLTGETLLVRAETLHKKINFILEEYKEIDLYIIEARMQAFRENSTTAAAIFKTAQINFLSQYFFHIKNIKVIELNVLKARSLCFPGFHKNYRQQIGIKQKDYAFELIIRELGEEIFPKKIMKSGRDKGKMRFLEEAKDMSDAYILTKAICNLTEKEIEELC